MAVTLVPSKLVDVPAFRGMTEEEIQELLDIAEAKRFHVGEVILREGNSTQSIWIALEGRCEVLKKLDNGEQTVLASLEAPSIFGEMSFFHPAPHVANVCAQDDVRVLRIRRDRFDKLIERGSLAAYKLAYNVVLVLADRLRRMDERIADLVESRGDDGQIAEWSDFRAKLHGDWHV